jgi:hypothetical protein
MPASVYSVQIRSNLSGLAGEVIVSEPGEFSAHERLEIANRLGIHWEEELIFALHTIGDNESLLGPPHFTASGKRFWVYRPEEMHAH